MRPIKNAYNRARLEAVKHLQHKAKSVYISAEDIFENKPNYTDGNHWGYVRDKFRKEHGVEVLDTEKLIFHFTLDDNIMRCEGHIGYSLSEPKE